MTTDQAQRLNQLTLTQAAEACGVSRSTMKRRFKDGAFPGAQQDQTGVWWLPVEDLLAAGLTLARPGSVNQSRPGNGPVQESQPEPVVTLPMHELIAMNKRLAQAEAERDSLRREVATQTRALELAEGAIMRILEPGPASAAAPTVGVVDLREPPAIAVPGSWREWRKLRKASKMNRTS